MERGGSGAAEGLGDGSRVERPVKVFDKPPLALKLLPSAKSE